MTAEGIELTKTKVVTWQSPRGITINLTARQERMLRAAGVWPKDSTGQEFCSVSYGLHYGIRTFTDDQIQRLFADV